jgi:hypothetical protein
MGREMAMEQTEIMPWTILLSEGRENLLHFLNAILTETLDKIRSNSSKPMALALQNRSTP